MKNALIIGANGQDGSYLSELLLEKGYQVTGWVQDMSPASLHNLCGVQDRMTLVVGDLTNQDDFNDCLEAYRPDEIYNLAAPSLPYASWGDPLGVGELAGISVARLLESARKITPNARVYQASSSEMFGLPKEEPQSENTPFHPRNPYGVAKLYAHWMVVNFRDHHNMFAVSGILFNHESPRRGFNFVTRKITLTAAAIKLGFADELQLGDLNARRDWGFAPDYVRAMWMMLQHERPEIFVIGTGVTHTVREICELAFGYLDLDYHDYVIVDEALLRPKETFQLVANPRKAIETLGWEPRMGFDKIIHSMLKSDLELLQSTHEIPQRPLHCNELEALSIKAK